MERVSNVLGNSANASAESFEEVSTSRYVRALGRPLKKEASKLVFVTRREVRVEGK
jgi:hypothetical protein